MNKKEVQNEISKILTGLGNYNEIEKNLEVLKKLHDLKKANLDEFREVARNNPKFRELYNKGGVIVYNTDSTKFCNAHKIDIKKMQKAQKEYQEYKGEPNE